MIAIVELDTPEVETVNVPVVAPATTMTPVGTLALELFEERPTIMPPFGAAPFSVTVPVEVHPPGTDVGFKLSMASSGGLIVKIAVSVIEPCDAVIVAEAMLETGVVVIVNVAVVAPAATVTDDGRVVPSRLEERLTVDPPVGAGVE